MRLVSEGILVMVTLIKACGGFPNTECLCRLWRTKLDSGLSERLSLSVSLFVEKPCSCVMCVLAAPVRFICVAHFNNNAVRACFGD